MDRQACASEVFVLEAVHISAPVPAVAHSRYAAIQVHLQMTADGGESMFGGVLQLPGPYVRIEGAGKNKVDMRIAQGRQHRGMRKIHGG
jgi:hypothetical protein